MGKNTKFNFGYEEEPTAEQLPLLQIEENWKEHHKGMPAFKQEDQSPYKSIIVHFAERKNMIEFEKLVKQKITLSTKYIWYPESEIQVWDKEWISEDNPNTEVLDEQ